MPIYEFVCSECRYEFEKILSFATTATPVCAKCGAVNVERQMGRPAIHFKGSGWYINDSKKGSSKTGNNPASSTGSDNGEGGAESAKTEKAEGAVSDKGTSGESKSAADSSSKEKPASKETTSSPVKAETA